MKTLYPYILIMILCSGSLFAQNEIDALRHSQTSLIGTARAQGMGGAFSAAGGDLTSATLNPAGLGVFRSSSFVVTPGFQSVTTRSDFLDQNQSAASIGLSLPSIGMAFNTLNYYDNGETREELNRGLKSYTFAIGFNQLENYRRNAVVTGGYNPYSSISELAAQNAQGTPFTQLPFDFFEELAFQTFVIDTVAGSGGTEYFPAVSQGQIEQSFQLEESGRRNEWYAAIGGNFGDKLYLGGSVNLQTVRYSTTFNFNETDVDGLYEVYDPFMDNFPPPGEPGFDLEIPTTEIRFTDEFTTRGSGISGRVGMIYRPIDAIRIGFSAQTPTYLSLTDQFSSTLTHTYAAGASDTTASLASELAQYDYSLFTPYRLTGGLMLLLNKSGFITVDVEYVDYSASELSSGVSNINDPNFYSFSPENQRIDDLYRSVVNLRAGAELRFNTLRIRGGYAYYPSPMVASAEEYLSLDNVGGSDFRSLVGVAAADAISPERLSAARTFLTFGLGVRQPNFFFDVSLVNQRQAEKFSPYTLEDPTLFQPTIVNRVTRTTINATLGFNY